MSDRYTEDMGKIAAYLDAYLLAHSSHKYYIPQTPRLSMGPVRGEYRFGVLIQRGKITNEIDGGDSFPYSDRIIYEIFLLLNDGNAGDKDAAVYFNTGVDEIITALRSSDVGDPPFGIADADENRVVDSQPGSINKSVVERITLAMLTHREY